MMRPFLIGLFLILAPVAQAQTPAVDAIVQSLTKKGYHVIAQQRTWLGRERLIVENSTHRRELVFNPATGEILRDYAVLLTENGSNPSSAPVATANQDTLTDPPTAATELTPDLELGDPVATYDGDIAE